MRLAPIAPLFVCLTFVATLQAADPLQSAKPRQVARLKTIGIDGSDPQLVHEGVGFETPNWTPDGKWLVFNGDGKLWRISASGNAAADNSAPELIPVGDVQGVNNDHLLSPDGKTIYFSARGHLYAVPIAGGTPRRVSNEHPAERAFKYYLHGISPDGRTLAYVGVEAVGKNPWGRLDLFTIPAAGGADFRLTDTPAPDDGPEYSPDGRWLYFNSELNAKIPGHAQCYRMKTDGSSSGLRTGDGPSTGNPSTGGPEQLTSDERVNWFPHLSPDGRWVVYISFPPGTTGHPANKEVILRRMRPDGSEQADIVSLFGGQGTINVNSWSPESQRFAYVEYSRLEPASK